MPGPLDEIEIKEYKGLKIGDKIQISEDRCEYLFSNIAEVTGFNPPHDIVHYKAPSIFGGRVHTGEYFKNIIKLDTHHQ